MELASTFKTSKDFFSHWPRATEALRRLHENKLFLPDYRYELSHDALQQTNKCASVNEIERALRELWAFDQRFFGDAPVGGGTTDFHWSVYCLAYLFRDEAVATDLLDVYCPLLGPFAIQRFGTLFAQKVCSTFMDDVGHVLFDIQGCHPAYEPDFFDWHGQRNNFSNDDLLPLESAIFG